MDNVRNLITAIATSTPNFARITNWVKAVNAMICMSWCVSKTPE